MSVDELSHMVRSSRETVFSTSTDTGTGIQKWLSNQTRLAKLPIIFYPLGLCLGKFGSTSLLVAARFLISDLAFKAFQK